MDLGRGQVYDAIYTLWADRVCAHRASSYLPHTISRILLLTLAISSLPLVAVEAGGASSVPPSTPISLSDAYPAPGTTATVDHNGTPVPTSADDAAYPDPANTTPSATPTHTSTPLEPSPQTEQVTSTAPAEETQPVQETPVEPTATSQQPTPEGESHTFVEEATPAEEEPLEGTASTLTPTLGSHVRALPTIVEPAPATSSAQIQDPLIPQELFTCSAVFLVLITIILGLHLARSDQSES